MNLPPQTIRGLVGLFVITLTGTVGYRLIEGLGWIDSLYMTIITVSTVGYGEVRALSAEGRIFSMMLIVVGVGGGFYLLGVIAEDFLDGRLRAFVMRSNMQRAIDRLQDHVILCGYGRFGKTVADELRRGGVQIVVIDSDVEREPEFVEAGVRYVIGSAVSDDVLQRAHVTRASAIVAATGSEADNVFITLAARELSPNIRVHARGESEAGVRRLVRAGAHHVTSPFHMGGMRTATSILRPAVLDFIELSSGAHESIELEEVRVAGDCGLAGGTIGDVEDRVQRLRVVALKRGDSPIDLAPERSTRLECDDVLIVIGPHEGLADVADLARPKA